MGAVSVAATSLALVLGLASLALILAAISTNAWVKETASLSSGLWFQCEDSGECTNVFIGDSIKFKHYEMVRGFSVVGSLMGLLAVVLSLLSFFKKTGVTASVVSTSYMVQAFFVMVGAALFTQLRTNYASDTGSTPEWGYSFVLGWTAFPCCAVAGIIMATLDSKKD